MEKLEFVETSFSKEKAHQMLQNQIQKDQTVEDFQTISTKKKHGANSTEWLSSLPKKTKVDDEAKAMPRLRLQRMILVLPYDVD